MRDRRRVFLYEIYTDKAAFDAHLKTDHFLGFDQRAKNWLVQKKWNAGNGWKMTTENRLNGHDAAAGLLA